VRLKHRLEKLEQHAGPDVERMIEDRVERRVWSQLAADPRLIVVYQAAAIAAEGWTDAQGAWHARTPAEADALWNDPGALADATVAAMCPWEQHELGITDPSELRAAVLQALQQIDAIWQEAAEQVQVRLQQHCIGIGPQVFPMGQEKPHHEP
jgi:hypothetical protein